MGVVPGVLSAVPVEAVVAVLVSGAEDGLRPDLEPTDVTPGVVGFAVTAIVVAGLIALLLSMVAKLRRVNLGAERPERPWASPDRPAEPDDTQPHGTLPHDRAGTSGAAPEAEGPAEDAGAAGQGGPADPPPGPARDRDR